MTEVHDWNDDDDWYEEWGDGRRDEDGGQGEEAGQGEDEERDVDPWESVAGYVPRVRTPPPAPPPVGKPCPECSAVVPEGMSECPQCLSPAGAGRRPERLPGGVLRLAFRAGGRHLDVPRGTELRLGRSGSWAPEASALLADEETVSGRHATVVHGEDGKAWVREVAQGATNGTRVNRRILGADGSARLRNGDRVELGPRVSFVVRGITDEPAEPED